MRRAVVYATAIAVLFGTGATAVTEASAEARLLQFQAGAPGDANRELRERQCRFQWLDKAAWTAREEYRTLACVVDRFGPIDGGVPKARAVGECESSWYRFAIGGYGGAYLGIFQHAAAYWPSRVAWAMPDGWRIGPWTRWANPRSQIVTTVRMVHANGWGAWSCA